MSEEILNKVREFVVAEFTKPSACYKESFDNHFKIVVRYGLEMAEARDADKEIVEIAAWLHDIASVRLGIIENHNIVGAEIAEKLLGELGYPLDKIKKVKYCILNHRGSLDVERETKEAQILADADAMSHFDDIDGILVRVCGGDKGKTLEKLERSYAKLSDDAKPLIYEKLEAARRELE